MFEGTKLERKKANIVRQSLELVPNKGEKTSWIAPNIGSFVLKNLDIESTRYDDPYFELFAGTSIEDQRSDCFRLERFVYVGTGEIIGVLRNTGALFPEEQDLRAYGGAIDFQFENKLIAPAIDDYDNVEEYLKSGKLHAIK